MSEVSIEKPETVVDATPAATHREAHGADHVVSRAENLKFATWLYLASEVVIFASMIGVFIVFRIHQPEIVFQVHHNANILLVTLNTSKRICNFCVSLQGMSNDLLKPISRLK